MFSSLYSAGSCPAPCMIDLQSADFLCLSDLQSAYQTAFGLYPLVFIRKLRLAYVVFPGFTRGEYHVIRVDFIVALRRTKGRGRRTLRSPPSPSSGLHLIHPGDPLRRGMSAAAGLGQCRYLYSGADRLSPVPNVVQLSVFGLESFAFQLGCLALVIRFSLLVRGTVRACGYVGFGYSL